MECCGTSSRYASIRSHGTGRSSWEKMLHNLTTCGGFDDGYDDHVQSPNRSLRLDSLSEKFKGSNFSFILGS